MASSFVKYNVFISKEGWKTGCCLPDIKRVEVFVGLKSTSQSCDHPLIVSRSVFKMKAAVCGLSIII